MQKAFDFWRRNPVEAVKDWFQVTPEDYQAQILNDCFIGDKDRIIAKSGHGVGKTTVLSWAGWLFLILREHSRVVATAPTFAQLHDVLWPEYAKWQVKMPEALSSQWDISGNHIRHKNKLFAKTWFAVSRTSGQASNLQGFHGSDIMVQGDEGSGISPEVFEVIEGILSEAGEEGKFARFLTMGNPNFNAGEFYDGFHRNRELYTRYTISGDPEIFRILKPTVLDAHGVPIEGTPDLEPGADTKDHGRVFYSKRVSDKYVNNMEKKYGRDGGVFDVRVRGIFPRHEDMAVIPLLWAQRAANIPLPPFDRVADPVVIVMDVSRQGADETVCASFRKGHMVRLKTWAKTSTVQCEDILVDERMFWQEQGLIVSRIIVDEPGVGGGVVDGARRRGLPITSYHGGESLKKDKDPEEDIRMFANRRARDYWHVRRMMEQGQISILDDETTINQLASVHYDYNKSEKIQVESKREMRDRLGEEASPDRADVIVMGSAPWYSFRSANAFVAETDVVYGEDRPQGELDLF
jgi:hypothetical protein